MDENFVSLPKLSSASSRVGPTRHDNKLLRAFAAISRTLNLGQPLPFTLNLIAEKVSQTMEHKYCAILLLNEDTDELLIEGAYGLPREYVENLNTHLTQRVSGTGPMAHSVTLQAFKTRMSVYVQDITSDPRFTPRREAALKAGYKSIVALPLLFRNEVIGVLNCYDEPRGYTEDQVEALMVVAEQAASAVGISRLISEQRATIEKLNSLNEHIVSQHTLLQYSESVHEALTALLLEDRPLDYITNTLAELLEAPVVLQDERLATLSRSGSGSEQYRGLTLEENALKDIQPLLTSLNDTGRARDLESGLKKHRGRSLLVAPVDMGKYGSGYLSAPLTDETKRDFLLRTLEQASTVYALYMTRQRMSQETEERIKGDLLADLMAGRFKHETEVRERAYHLGLDFARKPFRVFALRPESLERYLKRQNRNVAAAGQIRSKLLTITRRLAAGAVSGIAGADGDQLIALLSCPEDKVTYQLVEKLLRMVQNELPNLQVRVGISGLCAGPHDLVERYEELHKLLDLAETLGAVESTIYSDDWAVYGLLLRKYAKEELLDLAHRVLDPLLAYEKHGQSNLLTTLQAYLDTSLSPARTARELYVHTNTVKYRLGKISRLLGMNVDHLDNVLTIKVALMIRSLDPGHFDSTLSQNSISPM